MPMTMTPGPNGYEVVFTGGEGGSGASAYEVALAAGFVGTVTEWLASLKGPPGVDGDDGAPGPANTLSIGTVTTGAAGSSAAAAITGTPPSQVLALTIPRGDQGIQGPSGDASAATCKLTADAAALTATALANVAGLAFAVTAGNYYSFEFVVLFQSAATTTGLRLGLTLPAATVYSARAQIPLAADGVSGEIQGWLTSSGDSVLGTGVQAANTTYAATIRGMILPSASGTLQVQAATEVASSAVTIKQGTHGVMRTV